MEQKFFVCEHCGNFVGMVKASGVPLVCCGTKMKEVLANVTEASAEKHLPVVSVSDGSVTVSVGSVAHPMLDAHSILWVYLQTERGGQRKRLEPGQRPEAVFLLGDDTAVAAFAFCDLHGLWKTVI